MRDNPLTGAFIDAAVLDPAKAAEMLAQHPELRDARWLHEETALHFLAVEGSPEAVAFLVGLGLDVNATNEFGDTALVDAVLMGNLPMTEMLLRLGANPNAPSHIFGAPLFCAASRSRVDLAEALLRAGAKPDFEGPGHETLEDELGMLRDADAKARLLALLAQYGFRPGR